MSFIADAVHPNQISGLLFSQLSGCAERLVHSLVPPDEATAEALW